MQIGPFAQFAQNYAVRVSEFVRKDFSPSRVLPKFQRAHARNCLMSWQLALAWTPSATLFPVARRTRLTHWREIVIVPLARVLGRSTREKKRVYWNF
jgi:hypothetical protein